MKRKSILRETHSKIILSSRKRTLTEHVVRECLLPYGVVVDSALAARILRYLELLLAWNRRVNLTSIRDPREILKRHFGESFFAATAVPIARGRLVDVGSGAGFPGLGLKLIRPGLAVDLLEPNAKKAAFLAEVSRQLELFNVQVVRKRYDTIRADLPLADFLTARALGHWDRVIRFASKVLHSSGTLVLWLGPEDARTVAASPLFVWQEPVLIPESRQRFLLIGRRPS